MYLCIKYVKVPNFRGPLILRNPQTRFGLARHGGVLPVAAAPRVLHGPLLRVLRLLALRLPRHGGAVGISRQEPLR